MQDKVHPLQVFISGLAQSQCAAAPRSWMPLCRIHCIPARLKAKNLMHNPNARRLFASWRLEKAGFAPSRQPPETPQPQALVKLLVEMTNVSDPACDQPLGPAIPVASRLVLTACYNIAALSIWDKMTKQIESLITSPDRQNLV